MVGGGTGGGGGGGIFTWFLYVCTLTSNQYCIYIKTHAHAYTHRNDVACSHTHMHNTHIHATCMHLCMYTNLCADQLNFLQLLHMTLQILQQRQRAPHRPETPGHGEEPRAACTLYPGPLCPGPQSCGPGST